MDTIQIRLARLHRSMANSGRDFRDMNPPGRQSDDQKHYHNNEKRDDKAAASWRTRCSAS
jgi:hypothetical protein